MKLQIKVLSFLALMLLIAPWARAPGTTPICVDAGTAYDTFHATITEVCTLETGRTYFVPSPATISSMSPDSPAILSIPDGAILKFAPGASLTVRGPAGILNLDGTILFTSAKDNGGDAGATIEGYSGMSPSPGDYPFAIFYANFFQYPINGNALEPAVLPPKGRNAFFEPSGKRKLFFGGDDGGQSQVLPAPLALAVVTHMRIRYAVNAIRVDNLYPSYPGMRLDVSGSEFSFISSTVFDGVLFGEMRNNRFHHLFGGINSFPAAFRMVNNQFTDNSGSGWLVDLSSAVAPPDGLQLQFVNNLLARNNGYSSLVHSQGPVSVPYLFAFNTFADNTSAKALFANDVESEIKNNLFVGNSIALSASPIAPENHNAFFANETDYDGFNPPSNNGDLYFSNGLTVNPLVDMVNRDYSLNTLAHGGRLLLNSGAQPDFGSLIPDQGWTCQNIALDHCADDDSYPDIGYHYLQPVPIPSQSCACIVDSNCGDHVCQAPLENSLNCPPDCSTGGPSGGNGGSTGGNSNSGGTNSGGSTAVCNNNRCEATETEENCPADCRTDIPAGMVLDTLVADCPALTNPSRLEASAYGLTGEEALAAQNASNLSLIALQSTKIYSVSGGPDGHAPYLAVHSFQLRSGDSQMNNIRSLLAIRAENAVSKMPFVSRANGIEFSIDRLGAGQTIRFSINQGTYSATCGFLPPLLLDAVPGEKTGISTVESCSVDSDCVTTKTCFDAKCLASSCVLFQRTRETSCGFGQTCNAIGECLTVAQGTGPVPQGGDSTLWTVIVGFIIGLVAVLGYFWLVQKKTFA